jgi:hypothetical protein
MEEFKNSTGQILVQDPLSDVTRSERRMLLGISILVVAIVKTGLIPTKISALGIEFSSNSRMALLWILALIVGYFLVAFLIYAFSDFIGWRLRLNQADIAAFQKPNEKIIIKAGSVFGRFKSSAKTIVGPFVRPISFLRALFEFLVPIVVGIYALIISICAR